MAKYGKKYNASAQLVDRSKLYDVNEAIDLVCQTAKIGRASCRERV